MLTSTGQLGRPEEWFNAAGRWLNGMTDYPEDPEAQLGMITTAGATPNGVYALKIFVQHFDRVRDLGWPARLENLSFVHLERRDVLGQALSLARAQQTRSFRASQPAQNEAVYDFDRINRLLVNLIRDNARWRYYLNKNGLTPVHLYYEDVVANPAEAVRAIAEKIGLSGHLTIAMDKVGVTVQRDENTEEWRERFLAEAHDPCRLD
jgi:LPS sulfotransferase NodH